MPKEKVSYTKPFLRWAGGKSWLIKHLDQIIGEQVFNNYHEPFLGGGSIYFYLSPKNKAYLSDLNGELISTYKAIKESPDGVIAQLKQYHNTSEDYYAIRERVPQTSCEVAARFIFLNQTSFNGIYRVNANGKYNVPYGNRTKEFLEEDKLRAASLKLKNATLMEGDFDCIRPNIQKGDLVFLDPPYTVSHNNNGFIKYNQKLFSVPLHNQPTILSLLHIQDKNM